MVGENAKRSGLKARRHARYLGSQRVQKIGLKNAPLAAKDRKQALEAHAGIHAREFQSLERAAASQKFLAGGVAIKFVKDEVPYLHAVHVDLRRRTAGTAVPRRTPEVILHSSLVDALLGDLHHLVPDAVGLRVARNPFVAPEDGNADAIG